jgi:hypothetical protein
MCKLFFHKEMVLFYEKGNEDCNCGADHTYYGCSRCGQSLEDFIAEVKRKFNDT